MISRNFLAGLALFCGIAGAQGAPDDQQSAPSASRLPAMQLQASRLASSISAVIKSAESSAKSLSSTDREATIQSAIQGTIVASGDDPKVVLDTLRAFAVCPGSAMPYSVTQIPVSCTNLKGALSPEAREALASVEKVIVALVDQSEEPGALGNGGRAPFYAMAGEGGRGGGGNVGPKNASQGQPSGSPLISGDPSIESESGPGGGGSSGYNTN